eukprot:GHRQ01027649.1.p2 GENE.GHRQ01027649.1~~GHRQ01027649.1.p2  ORF type:complete len:101 (-),score=15.78 GHRQ01027649.1:183-485(-)
MLHWLKQHAFKLLPCGHCTGCYMLKCILPALPPSLLSPPLLLQDTDGTASIAVAAAEHPLLRLKRPMCTPARVLRRQPVQHCQLLTCAPPGICARLAAVP